MQVVVVMAVKRGVLGVVLEEAWQLTSQDDEGMLLRRFR
jgi:hypothetical protein